MLQRGGAWAGWGPTQPPPRCTKYNSHPSTASVPTLYCSMWQLPLAISEPRTPMRCNHAKQRRRHYGTRYGVHIVAGEGSHRTVQGLSASATWRRDTRSVRSLAFLSALCRRHYSTMGTAVHCAAPQQTSCCALVRIFRSCILYSSLFTITVVQYNIKNTLTNKLN